MVSLLQTGGAVEKPYLGKGRGVKAAPFLLESLNRGFARIRRIVADFGVWVYRRSLLGEQGKCIMVLRTQRGTGNEWSPYYERGSLLQKVRDR